MSSSQTAGITGDEFLELFLEQKDFDGSLEMIQDSRDSGPDKGDISFSKHHGLFAGFSVWLGSDKEPVWRVVDVRFVFPSESKASLYHKERLKANSEGHPKVKDAIEIGQQSSVFGGSAPNPFDPTMEMVVYYYIFQVLNVVVKLFIAQGPNAGMNGLEIKMAAAIARRIESRIKAHAY